MIQSANEKEGQQVVICGQPEPARKAKLLVIARLDRIRKGSVVLTFGFEVVTVARKRS